MFATYMRFVLKHRWLVIVLSLLWVLAATSGALKLGFTNNYQAFFSEQNPQLVAFEKVQETYSRSDNILVMMVPGSGNVFEASTLQAVLDFTEEAWKIPHVRRVDSLSNYQYSYGVDDDLIIEDLVYSVDDVDFDELREIALGLPIITNRLISPAADATAVNIVFDLPSEFDTPKAVEAVRGLVKDLGEKYPDLEFYESGVVMLDNALFEATVTDLTTLFPMVYVVVAIGVAFFLRSFWLTVVSIGLVLLCIGAAMGVAGWFGVVLTPPSGSAPPIIMTLAVADCIHILITLQQKQREGLSKDEAITSSIDLNLSPVFLTSVTTALGFLTLNFSDAPPFRDLGNIVAVGVIFAFILSMTFLPAVLSLLPLKKPRHLVSLGPAMGGFADTVIKYRRWCLFGGLAIVLGLSSFIPRNELNDNFIQYFDQDIEFRTDSDTIVDRLTGIYFVEYSINSGKSDGINDPEFLVKLEAFERWLQEQPEVIHVNSFLEVIRELNYNLHGSTDKSMHKLPESQDESAQYLLLYEMSLPRGLGLNNQINVDKSATRVSVSLQTLSTTDMLAFEKRTTDWMQQNMAGMETVGVSPAMMFSHISIRNITSLMIGTALALVLISVLLIIPFRSVRHGALSLVSNIFPACVGFGIWALILGEISLGVSVVIAMTLGIVVDDTIHLISKYLRARREMNLNPVEAVRYTIQTVGVAVFATTASLTAGFMVLANSHLQINSHLSIVSAIIIVSALIIDLVLLPPMLLWLDRKEIPDGILEA